MRLNTKLLLALLLLITIFSSCKKDSSDDNGYYFKFKMNGNWITWKEALADLVTQGGQTEFSLSSRNAKATEYIYMLINPDNGANLVPGTYTTDNSLLQVSFVKHVSPTDFTNYSDDASDTRYEVAITSVTDKTIKGTFKGNYLTNDFDDNDRLNITEGEFSLQRVR